MKPSLQLIAFTSFAALATTACPDDNEPGADTIDDTSDAVDTSDTADTTADGTDTTADTFPDTADTGGDTTADTTPDTTDTIHPVLAVGLDELAAAGDPADWIELFNAGTSEVDLTGWLFRDDDPTHAYVFPAGSSLAAGAYLVLTRDDTTVTGFDFGLGGADAAFLYDPDERLVDQTTWLEGESPVGGSWGRIPNASGAFQTLVAPTPGAANVDNPASTCGNDVIEALEVCDATQFGDLTCASFGWGGGTLTCADECSRVAHDACTARDPGLVINEVESDEADRIELHNGTPATIDISGWVVSDSGGGSYTLPAATTLASGAYLVLERDVNHTFGLGDSDAVTLTDGGGTVVDSVGWSAGRAIPSYCRTPNGVGGFRTCDDQTFGNANF